MVRTCCILLGVALWCMLLAAADVFENYTSSIVVVDHPDFRLIGRYLVSLTNFDDPLELVVSLDGTIYLLDKTSGERLWSFLSGPPIYSSYMPPFDQDDNPTPIPAFFLDYDEDDWELSAYSRLSFDMKLPGNVDEFMMKTPYKSKDGSFTLGSKKTTIFFLDSKIGRLIESYTLPEPDSASKTHYKDITGHEGNTVDIMRTDYEFKSRLPNGEILWSVKIAAIDAIYSCRDFGNDEMTPSCHSRRLLVRKEARDKTQTFSDVMPPPDLHERDFNVYLQGFIFLMSFATLSTMCCRRRRLSSGLTIGKMVVSTTEIAKGSNGTIIFEGSYQKRQVAVKRLLKAYVGDAADKEFQNLMASDAHENIVTLYGMEQDKDFVYLSLELCACNLDDLIQGRSERIKNVFSNFNLWKGNGQPSPQLLTLLSGIVNGLAHLHKLGIVHRDLKPHNVLITKGLHAKISDMGISKQLLSDKSSLGPNATGCGSSGWQAPEQLNKDRQTRAVDLFSLGCILSYCISGGQHPFGQNFERDGKILRDEKDLTTLDCVSRHLIGLLLSPNPEKRPKASKVLRHPIFWDAEKRVAFIRATSDRLEDKTLNPYIIRDLQKIASAQHWDRKMDKEVIASLCNHKFKPRYNYGSVKHLLRAIRNLANHYYQQSADAQVLLVSIPEGLDEYFATTFPELFIEVYKVMLQYCGREVWFRDYL